MGIQKIKGSSAQLKFTQAQVNAIKNAPKGQLPGFMSGGVYQDKNVTSVGGRVGPVGGTIGVDRGKPFGSVNVKGKVVGKFGPQK